MVFYNKFKIKFIFIPFLLFSLHYFVLYICEIVLSNTLNETHSSLHHYSYLCSAIITTFLSIIGFIPNVYFFIKSFTYEGFYNRPTFRIMIMFLSFEYVIGIVIHVIFSTYYMSHYYLSIPLHVNTCSKLRIIDINWNELIIVTPLYFNIIRFFKIVLQRKVNYIFLLIVIILTLGPLVYLTTGQLFEINSYYVPKVGCNYDIYSDIPFFTSLLFINLYMLMAIPVIALIINCSIYFYVIRIKENFAVAYAIEQKKLFQGIAVQSILPLLGQLPVLFIMLLQTKCKYIIYL
uniref:G_PROTEIN_RECEP_F1_2 domain-containing protein n=1 Tax=Parastrongyloides trichosuri TaxID=131310 RepID=A0A0N5A676_PARTI